MFFWFLVLIYDVLSPGVLTHRCLSKIPTPYVLEDILSFCTVIVHKKSLKIEEMVIRPEIPITG